MSEELFKRYRPKAFKDIIGQEHVTKALIEMFAKDYCPHAILFSGNSGVGKTTLARMVAGWLHCTEMDTFEFNCADNTGVDFIRELKEKHLPYAGMNGGNRAFIFDECHLLSSAAQSAMLKITEDCADHAYFLFATTHPEKLIPTLKNRVTHFALRDLSEQELVDLISYVTVKEKISLTSKVLTGIVEAANGSARSALVLLDTVAKLKNEADQLNALKLPGGSEEETSGFQIAQLLFQNKPWQTIVPVIRNCTDEPETVRQIILSYASSVLLRSRNDRAAAMIESFQYDFFQSKKAGLLLAAYRITKS